MAMMVANIPGNIWCKSIQWRIQDFPQGGTNLGEGCQSIIWPIFPKNSMKMKKIGLEGGARNARS